jgi:hypothetical protein
VVRHHREVERPAQAHAAQRAPAGVVGLHADLLSAREAIGIGGTIERPLPPGVEGERRVDVRVAEEGPAQGIARGAGLARLAAPEGRRRLAGARRRPERQRRGQRRAAEAGCARPGRQR